MKQHTQLRPPSPRLALDAKRTHPRLSSGQQPAGCQRQVRTWQHRRKSQSAQQPSSSLLLSEQEEKASWETQRQLQLTLPCSSWQKPACFWLGVRSIVLVPWRHLCWFGASVGTT